jgi:hypothetical protein
MSDSDAWQRLLAAGFGPGEVRRALSALAGCRVPTRRRLRAWREVESAAALLAEGRTAAEIVSALRQRHGISRVTAYRRIWSAVSLPAPPETNDGHTAATR